MSVVNIQKQHSDFMAIARFIMIYGLVVHHVFMIPGSGSFPRSGMTEYTFLLPEAINAFFHMWFMTAVPMLSVISGYLFFQGNNTHYLQVIKKKMLTIAIPSWLWCGLWLLFAYVLYLVGHERGLFEWANYHFDEFSLIHLANGIIGITDYPFAFQFWFVHDLLLTFLLYPVIRFGLQKLGVVFVLLCFVVWASAIDIPVFFSPNVFFFFVVGGFLSHHKTLTIGSLVFERHWALLAIAVFLIALILRAWTHLLLDENAGFYQLVRSQYFLLFLRATGVLASFQIIWWLSNNRPVIAAWLRRLSPYSFFVFAVHYPVVELVKIIVGRIPYQSSNIGVFLSWLLIPIITTLLCIALAKVMNHLLPKLTAILNGQRHFNAVYTL